MIQFVKMHLEWKQNWRYGAAEDVYIYIISYSKSISHEEWRFFSLQKSAWLHIDLFLQLLNKQEN